MQQQAPSDDAVRRAVEDACSRASSADAETRRKAEAELLEFRGSEAAVMGGLHILRACAVRCDPRRVGMGTDADGVCCRLAESSGVTQALFHAAVGVREGVLRAWSSVSAGDRAEVRDALLHFASGSVRELPPSVRTQCLVGCAVIWKMEWPSAPADCASRLLALVRGLLSSPDHSSQSTAIALLRTLTTELAAASSSTSLGVAAEKHCDAKRAFEAHGLREFLETGVEVLNSMAESIVAAGGRASVRVCVCKRACAHHASVPHHRPPFLRLRFSVGHNR